MGGLALENKQFVEGAGARVQSGVDARNLSSTFGKEKFDTIVFNNPNTEVRPAQPSTKKLLGDFFSSASQYLNNNGAVIVTVKNSSFIKVLESRSKQHGLGWFLGIRAL